MLCFKRFWRKTKPLKVSCSNPTWSFYFLLFFHCFLPMLPVQIPDCPFCFLLFCHCFQCFQLSNTNNTYKWMKLLHCIRQTVTTILISFIIDIIMLNDTIICMTALPSQKKLEKIGSWKKALKRKSSSTKYTCGKYSNLCSDCVISKIKKCKRTTPVIPMWSQIH